MILAIFAAAASADDKGKTAEAQLARETLERPHVLIDKDRVPIGARGDEAGRPRGALVCFTIHAKVFFSFAGNIFPAAGSESLPTGAMSIARFSGHQT